MKRGPETTIISVGKRSMISFMTRHSAQSNTSVQITRPRRSRADFRPLPSPDARRHARPPPLLEFLHRADAAEAVRDPGFKLQLPRAGFALHLGANHVINFTGRPIATRLPFFQLERPPHFLNRSNLVSSPHRASMEAELSTLLAGRRGHFQMESGYHSEHWFELDRLLAHRERLRPFVNALARQLAPHNVDAICGPMNGGAELAQRIGHKLNLPAYATERHESPAASGFFPVRYRVPSTDRAALRGKSIAIVDDAISAGSAIRGTYEDLLDCGARPIVAGALIIFGPAADSYAKEKGLALTAVARLPFNLWKPDACPLCARGVPFEKISDAPAK